MLRAAILFVGMGLLAACTEQGRATHALHQEQSDAPAALYKASSAGYERETPQAQLASMPASARPLSTRRMITRSAQVRVVASDPVGVARALGTQVEAEGGYVSDSKQWRAGDQVLASMTIRVPVDKLESTLESIRHAAIRVESENLLGEDVTEEYTDLGAQLTNLRATETELRALLVTVRERTRRAADIMEVFNQLTEVQGQIDQIEARITTLDKLAALATINLDLVPDALAQPLTVAGWQPTVAVRGAFRTLLSTLKALIEGTIWILVYLVPVVLVLAVPALGLWGGVRAIRKRLGIQMIST
jgi:hypothetical protein